jgi:hypothetical protein
MNWDSFYYTLIGAGFGAVVMFYLYMESKYKNKVMLKEIVNGRTIIKTYRARYYEDSDKSAWWRLGGERRAGYKLIPLPPDEAIEITHKAKKFVQGYRFETGEVVYIRDDWSPRQIPVFNDIPDSIQKKVDSTLDYSEKKKLLDAWKKGEIEKWKKDNKIITPYQPVTTNQRMGYFSNIKKAESRKTNDWKQMIVPLTAISGMVIIILGLMIFWGEIAQPALQAGEITKQNLQVQNEIVNTLKDIKLGIQSIGTGTSNNKNAVPD